MSYKVSIQVPTYNQQQYISQAIESCLAQDYPNLEIVIADDCSTDDTARIVARYKDERIRYFRNEKNMGRVANYRKALYEYCTGDWVVNLDGDDYYINPGFISRGIELINRYQNQGQRVVFYQSTILVADEISGNSVPRRHHLLHGKEYGIFDHYYPNVYRKNKFFSHLTTIYHRETAMRIGFYEFNTLNIDMESMAKLSLYGKVILDNTTAGVWRLHAANATLDTRKAFKENGAAIFERLTGYAKEAYGKDFDLVWKEKIKKENEVLHLEWLAENESPSVLLKYVFKYHQLYLRIPVLFIKSIINSVKAFTIKFKRTQQPPVV